MGCPYLTGTSGDKASDDGRCTRFGSEYPVHLAYQQVHCITSRHERCPVLLGQRERPHAPVQTRRAEVRRRRLGRAVPLAFLAVALAVPLAVAAAELTSEAVRAPDLHHLRTPLILVSDEDAQGPLGAAAELAGDTNDGQDPAALAQTEVVSPIGEPAPPSVSVADLNAVTAPASTPVRPSLHMVDARWVALERAYFESLLAASISDPSGTDDSDPSETDVSPLATLLSWEDTLVWTMKPGDNLKAVAEDFDTTVAALQALNDLAPDAILMVGQEVLVPVGFRLPLEP